MNSVPNLFLFSVNHSTISIFINYFHFYIEICMCTNIFYSSIAYCRSISARQSIYFALQATILHSSFFLCFSLCSPFHHSLTSRAFSISLCSFSNTFQNIKQTHFTKLLTPTNQCNLLLNGIEKLFCICSTAITTIIKPCKFST